ncbi:MAG: hypothetical protein PHU81_06640 [Acidobacteriota bacterium]|nr:hypothetical protein [Acidobacteriota bacterium]
MIRLIDGLADNVVKWTVDHQIERKLTSLSKTQRSEAQKRRKAASSSCLPDRPGSSQLLKNQ